MLTTLHPTRIAMMASLAFLLLAIALSMPSMAHAASGPANLWIDTTGGSCARAATPGAYVDASACSSMQAAVAACSPGDTIRMREGTYGSQTITTSRVAPGCTVIGETTAPGVKIGGLATRGSWFEAQNISGSGWDIAGAVPDHVTCRNCNMGYTEWRAGSNISWIGGRLGDVSLVTDGALVVEGCDGAVTNGTIDGVTFDNIKRNGAAGQHTEVVRIDDNVTGFTIKNSRFTNTNRTNSSTILIGRKGVCGGTAANVTLENNFFDNNADNQLVLNFGGAPSYALCTGLKLNYNTFINGESLFPPANCSNPSAATVTGNLGPKPGDCNASKYDNNVWTGGTCGASDLSVASLGLTGDGFHLSSGSAARANGSPTVCPATDNDGDLRPGIGSGTCDAGADQYASGVADTTAPDTSLTSAPSGSTTSTSASMAFTATEAASTFQCRVDGGGWATCSSPASYSGLAVGAHSFDVRAIDLAGNIDATPATASWTVTTPVDTTPPDTTITSAPPGSTTSTSASLSFSATESGTFECRIDGGAWGSCASPKTYTGLAVGAHSADVRATDTAGNVDTSPATATWTITSAADTTPPNTSITSAPSGSTTATSAALTFSATESVTFECRMDGSAWGSCTSPRSYAGLAVGVHTFDVRATDLAGNTDLTPASAGWTVVAPADTTAPDTSIVSGPTGSTASTAASLAFSATESATFECRIDAGAWGACTSPKAYTGLAAGAHTFDVRATDTAGNTDLSPASRAWTITAPSDTTPPDTTITSGPTGTDTSAALAFTASEAGSTFECRLDGGTWASCTSPKSYAALAAGAHTFDVRATDAAGNADASPATRTWTVTAAADTTAPDTTITGGPPASTTETTATTSFTSTESGSTFQCRLDGGGWSSCASPEGDSGLAAGAHTFDVRATDIAGNVDETPATRSWTVAAPAPAPPAPPAADTTADTTAPNTTITSAPPIVTNSPSAAFTFTATETGSTFNCSIDGKPWRLCVSPRAYSSLARGKHDFRVRATDAAGNIDWAHAEYIWTITRRGGTTTYSFERLGSGSGSVRANSLEGACALVPSSHARLGVRLRGLSVRRGHRTMRISGKVPELAQDGVNARIRVSLRSHGHWRLLISRRVHVHFDGSFRVKAPRRSGKLKVTAVARCG
jgi:hypothetical protein